MMSTLSHPRPLDKKKKLRITDALLIFLGVIFDNYTQKNIPFRLVIMHNDNF